MIYWKRVDACLEVCVVLAWGKLEEIPLTAVVVVVIHPVIDLGYDLTKGFEPMNDFFDVILHVSVEALLWCVIPAVSFPGHGLYELCIFEFFDKGIARIVTALIGVMPNSG